MNHPPITSPVISHSTRHLLICGLIVAAGACANIEPPPGGPVDNAPPILLTTVPESLGVFPDFDDRVEFVFNEVISEGSSANLGIGTGTLEQLLILSPTDEVPRVGWRRNRITLEPREGWRRNRVYRVELLPGVADIEGNRSEIETVLTFTTGAPLPGDTLRGQVIDWVQGRPTRRGLILATLMPDSLTYRSFTDSVGRFAIGPLPTGAYHIAAVVDANTNLRLDYQEAFDSLSLTTGNTDAGALWAFPHDTTGPRVQTLAFVDSLTLSVSFTQFLDPTQFFDTAAVRVVSLPDSIPIGVSSLAPQAIHDSLYPRVVPVDTTVAADSLEIADSVAVTDSLTVADSLAADSLAQPPPPQVLPGAGPAGAVDSATRALLDSRPPLFDRLLIRVTSPLVREGRYFVAMGGLLNINGVLGEESGAGILVPAPPPPPPLPEPEAGDSLAVPDDSLAAPSDSLDGPVDDDGGEAPPP